MSPQFSIITPSFRNSNWLKLCIASVADQEEVELEHIVQDSCSDDGTQDWLPNDPRVKAFIEKDSGMYDAVNRGFRRASGDILAYLNCDEQYLPNALRSVGDFFGKNPDVDIVVSDAVVTDGSGNYICHRYSLRPISAFLSVAFPVLTCAIFLRRKVVDPMGVFFDTQWRDLGDVFWIMELANRGLTFAVLPRFTSVFTDTGENMNLKPNALREKEMKWQRTPQWVRWMRYPIAVHNRLRLFARGANFQRPFEYSIYTLANPAHRTIHFAAKPTSFWKGRFKYAFAPQP